MCYKTFPDGYIYLEKIDLQKNKKQFWLVQGLGLLIMAIMFVIGFFIAGFDFLNSGDYIINIIAVAVLIAGYVLYIIAHEATHAVFMYAFAKCKLNFGFVGWAAYAGSTGYFDKKHYIIIALAPLVVWGIVFGILNVFFNSGVWFWVIWLLQIGNVSGASGDLFCTYKMATYPKDILIHDTGMEMTVFVRKTDESNTVETENSEQITDINEEQTTDIDEENLSD